MLSLLFRAGIAVGGGLGLDVESQPTHGHAEIDLHAGMKEEEGGGMRDEG